jgi:chromosome segregation ATPase
MIGAPSRAAPQADGLGALAELIANPDAYRAKITELKAATTDHAAALQALHATQAEIADREAALGLARADLETEQRDLEAQRRALAGERAQIAQAQTLNKKRGDELDAQSAEQNNREHRLNDQAATLQSERDNLARLSAERDADHRARTKELNDREARLTEARTYVETKARDLERRYDELRRIVNDPTIRPAQEG